MIERVSDENLKYFGIKFDYCEKVSGELFGQPIKHTLLLHANELIYARRDDTNFKDSYTNFGRALQRKNSRVGCRQRCD